MKANIREITVRSIMERSALPDADYEINPYVGCTLGCLYCYAGHVQDRTGHKEPWGDFVDVKINGPDLVPVDTGKYKGCSVFIGSITDPYLPVEEKYQMTRRILERLIPLEPDLALQTKSTLVLRDIDLLTQFDACEVGTTVISLNEEICQQLEPGAPPVHARLDALRALHEQGISTYIFMGPLLPALTDWKQIIRDTRSFVDCFIVERLDIAGGIWQAMADWLSQQHPDLLAAYQKIFFSNFRFLSSINRFSWRHFQVPVAMGHYFDKLYADIRCFAEAQGVNVMFNDWL